MSGLGAAGARQVLDHDIGLAGNVATHMARQRACIDVKSTAWKIADDEVDGLAGIIVGGRSRGGEPQGLEPHHDSDKMGEAMT